MKRLYEEIASDIIEIEKIINQYKIRSRKRPEFAEAKQFRKNFFKKKDLIRLVRSVIERPNFVSKNITFSSLKSTSNLQLIRDLNLRNLLFDYDQKYQALKTAEMAELHAVGVITF